MLWLTNSHLIMITQWVVCSDVVDDQNSDFFETTMHWTSFINQLPPDQVARCKSMKNELPVSTLVQESVESLFDAVQERLKTAPYHIMVRFDEKERFEYSK